MTQQTSMRAFARSISFFNNQKSEIKKVKLSTEILCGLTVSLALVPEAIAFAFVAGVAPLVGLYAAFIVGIITAVFGGRPGMISGATGALAVVMVSLVASHGVDYLFASVVLMGIMQLIAGFLRLGKFIRMVPHPVMLGFVNGLAVVIFLAQLEQFKFANSEGTHIWMSGTTLYLTLSLVFGTMFIIWLTSKVSKAIPPPLVAIGIVTGLVVFFNIAVPRVGDLASMAGSLPEFHIPEIPLTFEAFKIILPYSLILAMIGLIESLLTLNLVGEITGKKGGASQECLAQGAANTITGFFGGMGGCAMIGQSMININSGGRTRISGISAALFLLLFILYGSSIIEMIPLAALVGVMFMVVIGTFAWNSLRLLFIVPRADALVILLVTFVTVMEDLAIAVIVGVIVSALVYAWENATMIRARKRFKNDGTKVYEIWGPLFFGSIQNFNSKFDIQNDPKNIEIDFIESRVSDHSGIESIEAVAKKYKSAGKRLMLRHLSSDCHRLLNKSGQLTVMQNDDPDYELAVDYDVQIGRFSSSH